MAQQTVDPKAYDIEIAQHEKELGEIIGKMDRTGQAFVALCMARLKQWYPEAAKWHVQEQFELTNRLGAEKIASMKLRVTQLVVAAPTVAKRVLGDPTLWWHLERGGGWFDHHAVGPPDGLRMAVEALSERLSPILESYGYLKKEKRTKRDDDAEAQPPVRKGPDRLHLEWTAEMTKCVETYKEDLGRAAFLDQRIDQAKRRQAKLQAGLLWENV